MNAIATRFKVERINAYGYKVWLTADHSSFSSDEADTAIFTDAASACVAAASAVTARCDCYVVDHTDYLADEGR